MVAMSDWPELSVERDHETLALLHLAAQMIGKIRVSHAPRATRDSSTAHARRGSSRSSARRDGEAPKSRDRARHSAGASRSSPTALARLCILLEGAAKALGMPDALLDRIAAAKDLQELDSVRVALLGKQGEITAKLKSLGKMSPDERTNEAPKIHALRERVTDAIADRKAALEA